MSYRPGACANTSRQVRAARHEGPGPGQERPGHLWAQAGFFDHFVMRAGSAALGFSVHVTNATEGA